MRMIPESRPWLWSQPRESSDTALFRTELTSLLLPSSVGEGQGILHEGGVRAHLLSMYCIPSSVLLQTRLTDSSFLLCFMGICWLHNVLRSSRKLENKSQRAPLAWLLHSLHIQDRALDQSCVMVSFMCQLGWAIVPSYFTQTPFRCCSEGIL